MFEQAFEEMTACVFIEDGLFSILTASNVAALPSEGFSPGANELNALQAVELVGRIDQARRSAPKVYTVRLRAFRNSVVSAFGPDLADRVGFA